MCVMIFPITFVSNISHFKKNSARYCHKHRSSCKVPLFYVIFILYLLFLPGFNRTWIFSKDFWKSSNQISWKSVQRELSCSMWTDGQTDRQTDRHMTKLIVTFRNFANVPKNRGCHNCFPSPQTLPKQKLHISPYLLPYTLPQPQIKCC